MTQRLFVDTIETIGFVGDGDDPEAEIVFYKRAPDESGDDTLLNKLLKALGLKKKELTKLLGGGADDGSDSDDGLDPDGDSHMAFDVEKMSDEERAAFDAAVAAKVAEQAAGDEEVIVTDDLPDAVVKALGDMEAAIEKANQRAESAETKVSEMEDARQAQGYIQKVKRLALPGASPDDFAPILRKMEASLDEDEVAKLDEVLKGAAAAIKLTGEIGRVAHDVTTTEAEVAALAKTYQEKDPTLTDQMARAKVWNDHPALYAKHRAERKSATMQEG